MQKISKQPKVYIVIFAVLIFVIIAMLVMYFGMGKNEDSFEMTNTAMGTFVQQTVYGKNAEVAANVAINDINKLEGLISWRINDSEISKINSLSGEEDWIDIDNRTMDILLKSIDVSQKSMGYYDLTILPVSKLWDFGGENQRVPSYDEIGECLPLIGYKNLKINEDVKRAKLIKKGSGIDLGAVGKGSACEVAVEAYKNNDADYGIIAVGGSVGVYGNKPNKTPWRIAIRDPFGNMDESSSVAIVKIKDGFVSTSGSYEKCFESDGMLYHHIINPKTGYPVQGDIVSVSIFHDDGTLSDLLSTACFSLGKERSIQILEYYGAQAVFIDKNKNIYATNKIKNDIEIKNEEYTLCDW